jgi:hypothetical protein
MVVMVGKAMVPPSRHGSYKSAIDNLDSLTYKAESWSS